MNKHSLPPVGVDLFSCRAQENAHKLSMTTSWEQPYAPRAGAKMMN